MASRTRAAAKVQTRASVKQKCAKATADLFTAPQQKPEKNSKSKPNEVSVITTAVSSKQQVPEGQIKASRRISNEFEKTEESLYVSALEDISDASRFYDARLTKQDSSDSSVGDRTLSSVSSSDSSPCEAQRLTNERVATPLPPGVEDFDKENWNDPFQVSHYARDIFNYLKQREQDYKIKDYMCDQPELSKWMRSLLIDWMVEVQESFELNHETLYLAVKIVDTYLGKERVVKDNLQLLGAASLLIACKYDVSLQ